MTPFGMSHNYVRAARFYQHLRRNLAGKRAFFLPMVVLTRNDYAASLRGFHSRRNRSKRRRNDYVTMCCVADQRQKSREKGARLRLCLVHLPVPRHPPAAFGVGFGAHRLVSASTPGSFRPPKNSSEAPPPVEMCEILSAKPD